MVRKDAAASSQAQGLATDTVSKTQERPKIVQSSTQESFPAVLPSTVVNIALHSLLMVTVPFALFFASHFGALDRELLIGVDGDWLTSSGLSSDASAAKHQAEWCALAEL